MRFQFYNAISVCMMCIRRTSRLDHSGSKPFTSTLHDEMGFVVQHSVIQYCHPQCLHYKNYHIACLHTSHNNYYKWKYKRFHLTTKTFTAPSPTWHIWEGHAQQSKQQIAIWWLTSRLHGPTPPYIAPGIYHAKKASAFITSPSLFHWACMVTLV